MTIKVDINVMCNDFWTPDASHFEQWCRAALENRLQNAEVSVCIVDTPTIQQLNRDYRDKDKPTNVLSFPQDEHHLPEGIFPIGDVVICSELIEQEAKEQSKSLEAHWAHMVIHSVLHLLGMDHVKAAEAEKMEAIESELMLALGYPAPYGEVK